MDKDQRFSIFAESPNYDKPLFMVNLSFAQLMDEIVFPYENKEPFFIDGAPVDRKMIKRLKILRQNDNFPELFEELHSALRTYRHELQQTLGSQYHIRFEALLREGCEDVTAQVIKAYEQKIKPGIKDYLSKRPELISEAFKVFLEGLHFFGSQK